MSYTKESVRDVVKSNHYFWNDTNKDFILNAVGIKNVLPSENNPYNDTLVVSYSDNGEEQLKVWPVSLKILGRENFYYFYHSNLEVEKLNWNKGSELFKEQNDFQEFLTICEQVREMNDINCFTLTILESDKF